MIKISLYDMVGVGLIIKEPSNLLYWNQVGGVDCIRAEEEGILLPFNNDFLESNYSESLESKLKSLFEGKVHGEFSLGFAHKLDCFFQGNSPLDSLKVDMQMLSQSAESWVHVDIVNKLDTVDGNTNEKAVLTWPNSD